MGVSVGGGGGGGGEKSSLVVLMVHGQLNFLVKYLTYSQN